MSFQNTHEKYCKISFNEKGKSTRVALAHERNYRAIRCKFCHGSNVIDKPAVDCFLAASRRNFEDEQREFNFN